MFIDLNKQGDSITHSDVMNALRRITTELVTLNTHAEQLKTDVAEMKAPSSAALPDGRTTVSTTVLAKIKL